MKCNIRGDKLVVTDAIKNYIEEKLTRVDKYFENSDKLEVKVVVEAKGINQKIEVTINTKLFPVRAEESNTDLYAAIDLVIDKIEAQIRKNKTKLKNRYEKEKITEFFLENIDEEEESEELIVKRKNISLKPMDEEEAILQMELLGHSFFVFKNIDTSSVCVLYKRKDAKYGLIDTK